MSKRDLVIFLFCLVLLTCLGFALLGLDLSNLSAFEYITAVLGLATFFYYLLTVYRKRILDAIDLISVVRRDLIPAHDTLISWYKNKTQNDNFEIPRVGLDEPTFSFVREKYPLQAVQQSDLLKEKEYYSQSVAILNILQEFSLRVIHLQIEDSSVLNSVKQVFVEIVEHHAVLILLHKEAFSVGDLYKETLLIYQKWKDQIDRRTRRDQMNDFIAGVRN